MSRYINSESLLKAVEHYYGKYETYEMMKEIAEIVVPAADVQEEKHGKWEQVHNISPKYACTNCRHLFNNRTFNYCPNCGAKMEKG